MTVREALRHATRELVASDVPAAGVDAELLVAHVLGLSRSAVYACDRELRPGERARLQELIARRVRREPLAYVLGEWGFRRLTLRVDARALVPRPETEVLVERGLARLRALPEPRVLDVGTGSGAIALALADEHPGARVLAIDVDPEALSLARENAALTGLASRVTFADRALESLAGGERYDLVVANPPYVLPGEYERLEPEIRRWEPRHALVGEGVHERVAEAARMVLEPGGWLILECGDGQPRGVAKTLRALGYEDVQITKDLAGRERVVEGRSR